MTVEEVSEDPKKEEQMRKKEKMLKKRMLMMKLRAVNQDAGGEITAGYEPEGEMVEDIEMTRKAYNKIHKDFKSDNPKKPRTTKYVPGKGTVSMPVKFVDEAKYEAGASTYGKASIRNKRRFGTKGENPDPLTGKKITKR